VKACDEERRGAGLLRSFRAGLRQRSPLVLVAAAALTALTLLGLHQAFATGAWSEVPLKYWLRSDETDTGKARVAWLLARLDREAAAERTLYLLGGSTMREATVRDGASLAARVEDLGGPHLQGWNLATSLQTFAQSLAIVDNLPPSGSTTVVIGVSPGRFIDDRTGAGQQLEGRGLPLRSETLGGCLDEKPPGGSRRAAILPGILSMLVEKGRSDVVRLAQGEVPSWDYVQHAFDDEPVMDEAAKLGVFEAWWRVRRPQFERNVDFNLTLLEALVARCRQRGFAAVVVELPRNEALIGSRWEAIDAQYQPRARRIAAEHGVPYLDFNGSLGLDSADYSDHAHLRYSGRVVWETELAREIALLYQRGELPDRTLAGR
jgi:hypothetical protein